MLQIFIIARGASKNRAVVTSSSSDSIYKDAFYITKPISSIKVWIKALNFNITPYENDMFLVLFSRTSKSCVKKVLSNKNIAQVKSQINVSYRADPIVTWQHKHDIEILNKKQAQQQHQHMNQPRGVQEVQNDLNTPGPWYLYS